MVIVVIKKPLLSTLMFYSVLKEYTDEGCKDSDDGSKWFSSPRYHPIDDEWITTDTIPEDNNCRYSFSYKHLTLSSPDIKLMVS